MSSRIERTHTVRWNFFQRLFERLFPSRAQRIMKRDYLSGRWSS